ncbi:MAG TPA: CBS domain-containing protein [Myxococcota bacterium]|nr:CBS domain-containing protein [Myxococcota bacterium]
MTILARDVMQTHVVTIEADASLLDAQRLFVEEEINGAPVVDADGRVIGVLSARDLLRGAAEEQDTVLSEAHYYRDFAEFSGPDWANGPEDFQNRLASRTVSEVMTEGALMLAPDAPVDEIARTLRQSRIHRVLIAKDGVLVGIVSTFDLMALLEKEPPSR